MKSHVGAGIAAVLIYSLTLLAGLGIMNPELTEEDIAAQAEWEKGGLMQTPVLVIDAGHGGFDGGAEAADGTGEKDINLAIAQYLAERAADYQVKVIMTREGDESLDRGEEGSRKRNDLQNRKKIMEDADAALAVSVHLNSYPQDRSVYGAQVFYSSDEQERTDVLSSREIAEAVQNSLEINLPDGRTRSAMKKNDVLLLQNPPCRIILVECGFLSNEKEAELLKTAEYQQKLASAIWQGINEKLCLRVKKNIPVTDSTNK